MSSKVKAIPDGYHTLTPNLVVRGAAQAIDFYKKAFGAEETMRMPAPDGSIMHAELRIGDSAIMLGEEKVEMGCKGPAEFGGSPMSLYIYVENVDAASKRAVDAGAKVRMPVTDMFWGDRMGVVEDPFGYSWSLAQHVKDLTLDEIKKGQREFFAQMKQNKP